MDVYFELYDEINKTSPNGHLKFISIIVYDPSGKEIEQVLVQDSYKSFQKQIKTDGIYRICLRGTPDLYADKPNSKYEMSIQLEPLHELQDEILMSIGAAPTINLASKLVS